MRKRLPAPELEQSFYDAVEAGAAQRFMSLTAYQKFALLNQVKSDGLDPSHPSSSARPCTRPAACARPGSAAAERHVGA
jgi:hypothetical protein